MSYEVSPLRSAVSWLFLVIFVPIQLSNACGMMWKESDSPALMKAEKTLIVWDSQKKQEDFIRTINFQSQSENLGLVVPLPSIPVVSDFDEAIFKDLDQEMERQRPSDYRFWPEMSLGADGSLDGAVGTKGLQKSRGGVQTLATYELANFDVKVIAADSLSPLVEWMKERSFGMRPSLEKWLASYVEKKWCFAVFSFRKKSTDPTFRSQTVKLSFTTDKPIYPYKDSEDNVADPNRNLLLYFISDKAYGPDFLTSDMSLEKAEQWDHVPNFSNLISKNKHFSLESPWLTLWQDQTQKRPDRDLSFSPRTEVSDVHLLSPKIIDLSAYVILGLFLLLITGTLYGFYVLTKKIFFSKK